MTPDEEIFKVAAVVVFESVIPDCVDELDKVKVFGAVPLLTVTKSDVATPGSQVTVLDAAAADGRGFTVIVKVKVPV